MDWSDMPCLVEKWKWLLKLRLARGFAVQRLSENERSYLFGARSIVNQPDCFVFLKVLLTSKTSKTVPRGELQGATFVIPLSWPTYP